MTDEPVDAESKTAPPDSVEPDEDRAPASPDDKAALKDWPVDSSDYLFNLEVNQAMLAFVLGNFSAAFVQALGQRAADGAAKLPNRIGDLVRTHVRRKGKPDEARIGVDDGSAATIAITADTPDEARLALLDLDITDDTVRGKVLRWDSSASAWRPDDDQ